MNEPKKDHQQSEDIEAAFRILEPLFGAVEVDPLEYSCALLRVEGAEEDGWDTLTESLQMLDEINCIAGSDISSEVFKEPEKTRIRLHLLAYSHLIEMDAPYEIIANLLRVRIGIGWTVDPFLDKGAIKKWSERNSKRTTKFHGIPLRYPVQKIQVIKNLATRAGLPKLGQAFDEFYFNGLRNAVFHADYVLHEREFRMRKGHVSLPRSEKKHSRVLSFSELLAVISKAYAFYNAFFTLENSAREQFGSLSERVIPYDRGNKGLLEFLVNDYGLLDGWVVHWPNATESRYRRSSNGSRPLNIMAQVGERLQLFVGERFSKHDPFSPLVPAGGKAKYTPMDGTGDPLDWHAVDGKSTERESNR